MAELDAIAETLRRHRKHLEEQIDGGSTRSGETAELLERIESLRRRVEDTQTRFRDLPDPAPAKISE
jgi:predicted RNase H-like nuclease (RuvC/YqgF family)